jgi:hypothetical protein
MATAKKKVATKNDADVVASSKEVALIEDGHVTYTDEVPQTLNDVRKTLQAEDGERIECFIYGNLYLWWNVDSYKSDNELAREKFYTLSHSGGNFYTRFNPAFRGAVLVTGGRYITEVNDVLGETIDQFYFESLPLNEFLAALESD